MKNQRLSWAMSENLNVNIEATVDPESITCVESLESSYSDKTDHVHVEGIIPDVCINSSMDIIVPIENCVKSNCLILTENNVKINDEEEVVNAGNPTVDNILDIVIENTLDQMGLDATGTLHSSSVMSVPDVQNEIMEIHPVSEVIDHEVTNLITEEDNMTGKLKFLIFNFFIMKISIFNEIISQICLQLMCSNQLKIMIQTNFIMKKCLQMKQLSMKIQTFQKIIL